MRDYDPFNWYWLVGGKIFSSASGDYVPTDDKAFVEWKKDGTKPTNIFDEDELGEVLAPYNIRPSAAAVLDKYKDAQAKELTIKTVAKALFFMANEIRSGQGKPVLSPQQFRGWLKDLM